MPTPKQIHVTVHPSTATPAADSETGSPGDLTAAQKRYSLGDHSHVLWGKARRAAGSAGRYISEMLVSLGGSIARTNVPEDETIDLAVVCSSALPLSDGIASAGTPNHLPSADDHVHGLINPTSVGGKLYTAMVSDAYHRADVNAVFRTVGGCEPGLFENGWTQIATGVWRHNISGPLNDSINEVPHYWATDDVAPFLGMRLLAWSGSLSDAERAKSGVYVVVDTGDYYQDPITHEVTYHYATLARAPDCAATAQVYSGIWVHVTGGTIYGPGSTGFPEGATFQLSTPDPIELGVTPLTWSIVATPTVTPSNELLTAAQLSLSSPDTVIAGAAVSANTGEVEIVTCTERTADLAGVTIPGDKPIVCHVRVCIGVDDPAATTVIHVLLRGTNDPNWHLVGVTQPLHNVEAGDFTCPACTLGADYPMGISEELEAKFVALTNRADGATVSLTYNNAPHSTFIELPLAFGYAGADEHDKLTKPSRWLPRQHPQSSIEQVGATIDAANITAGRLVVPDGVNILNLTGAPTITGISVVPFPSGYGRLTIFFAEGGKFANNVDPGDGDFAPVDCGNWGGLSDTDAATMDFDPGGTVDVTLIAGEAWHPPNSGRKPT